MSSSFASVPEQPFQPAWRRMLRSQPAKPARRALLTAQALSHCLAGRDDSDDFVTLRPLGWRGMISFSLAALVEQVSTADLARCLSQHPCEAVQFLLSRLELGRHDPVAAEDLNASAGAAVWFRYHPRPDVFANGVAPRHGASPLASPTVHLGFFEGERKQASRGWDEDAATAAQNALAVIAIAMLLFGASLLFDRATAPAPVEPAPDTQLAQEASR